ncbi:MAG: hypothetical protein ACR2N4_06330 [Jatrophihabitans sp.]
MQCTSPDREPFEAAYLARLFVGSFRFSQGRPDLQVSILAELVSRHRDRIAADRLPEATERATPTLLRVMANHRLHGQVPAAEATELIDEQTAALERLLADPPPATSPITLATGMAEADLDYLSRPHGRPRVGEVDTGGSSWVDRWTGLLAYHAVLGQSAGVAEFDELFTEIGQALLAAEQLPQPVARALRLHFERHPEDAEMVPKSMQILHRRIMTP